MGIYGGRRKSSCVCVFGLNWRLSKVLVSMNASLFDSHLDPFDVWCLNCTLVGQRSEARQIFVTIRSCADSLSRLSHFGRTLFVLEFQLAVAALLIKIVCYD